MPTDRVEFLGVGFDPLTMREVLDRLAAVTSESPYGYVVTPNVDHVVKLDADPDRAELRRVFDGASLSVCDSRVLRKLARMFQVDLPIVPGSDLTVRLLNDVVQAGDRICVVGGDDALIAALSKQFPGLELVHHQPPLGLRRNDEARREAALFIARERARFTLVAVGSPQQEMIAAGVRRHVEARGMALCIGASLDFIAGKQRRAPRVLQQLSLEWAYRLASDPARLWRRYLIEGPRVFRVALREHRRKR